MRGVASVSMVAASDTELQLAVLPEMVAEADCVWSVPFSPFHTAVAFVPSEDRAISGYLAFPLGEVRSITDDQS